MYHDSFPSYLQFIQSLMLNKRRINTLTAVIGYKYRRLFCA